MIYEFFVNFRFLPIFLGIFRQIVSLYVYIYIYMLLSWHECFCSTSSLFLSFMENFELEQLRVNFFKYSFNSVTIHTGFIWSLSCKSLTPCLNCKGDTEAASEAAYIPQKDSINAFTQIPCACRHIWSKPKLSLHHNLGKSSLLCFPFPPTFPSLNSPQKGPWK